MQIDALVKRRQAALHAQNLALAKSIEDQLNGRAVELDDETRLWLAADGRAGPIPPPGPLIPSSPPLVPSSPPHGSESSPSSPPYGEGEVEGDEDEEEAEGR